MASASEQAAAFYKHDSQQKRITLTVHIQPGASGRAGSALSGLHGDALKVRIAAPAMDNKANTALISFLGKSFGVRAANITLLHGAKGRRKVIEIAEVSDALAAHIQAVIKSSLH